MKSYLNASEVAKLLNVDRATVTRWIQKGMLQGAIRLGGNQQWRIPFSSYEALLRRQNQREQQHAQRDLRNLRERDHDVHDVHDVHDHHAKTL